MDDFSTLAQIGRPQMMPNAPIGSSLMAGMQYGQDRDQYNNFLASAAQDAQVQARQRAMQAEEFAAGNPGRMAGIQEKNLQASTQLGAYQDTGRDADILKSYNALDEQKQKKIKASYDKYAPIVNGVEAAKDENEIQQAIQAGKAQIGDAGPFEGMSPQEAKMRAHAMFISQQKTPQEAQKLDIATTTGQNRLTAVAMQQAGANTRAEKANFLKGELAKYQAQMHPSQWALIQHAYPDDPEAQMQFILAARAAGAITLGNTNAGIMGAIAPDIKIPPAVAPKPPPVTNPGPPPQPLNLQGNQQGNPQDTGEQGDQGYVQSPTGATVINRAAALKKLQAMKGTPNYAAAKAYFQVHYGALQPGE